MNKKEIIQYLKDSIISFIGDPADTDFQRGYEAALREVYTVLTK